MPFFIPSGRLFLVPILVLSGCTASGPQFSGLAPLPERATQLVLYRTDAFLDGGVAWRVDLDGKKVAVLHNAEYAVVDAPPGSFTLVLRADSLLNAPFFSNVVLPLSPEPNTRVFVRAEVHLGAIVPPTYVGRSYTLIVVPAEAALADLQSLKLSE